MPNPFDFIREIREMNHILTEKLDEIIKRLDTLISVSSSDWYGDGK